LYLHHVFVDTLRIITFLQRRQNIIDESRRRLATLPTREWERLRAIEQRYGPAHGSDPSADSVPHTAAPHAVAAGTVLLTAW
jgi:hypothetical protein